MRANRSGVCRGRGERSSWRATAAVVAILAVSAFSGCGAYRGAVAQRASFDLGCTVSEEDVVDVGGGAVGVSACGCRATYLFAQNRPGYGVWVLNQVSGDECRAADGRASAARDGTAG